MGEATPPNSTNPEDLVNSTPYNKGTASVAEVNNDLRYVPPVIRYIPCEV